MLLTLFLIAFPCPCSVLQLVSEVGDFRIHQKRVLHLRRRSRSYSERRNRSRSPRRESSHAEHESSSRRQRDCAGSREASRANAHSDIEQCPSVRSDKVGTTDSRETHESHTRPNSRSGSNSRGGSCATEVHGRGDSQVGEQKRTSEPAGRLRSSSGSPPSRHTDESHPVSAIEA